MKFQTHGSLVEDGCNYPGKIKSLNPTNKERECRTSNKWTINEVKVVDIVTRHGSWTQPLSIILNSTKPHTSTPRWVVTVVFNVHQGHLQSNGRRHNGLWINDWKVLERRDCVELYGGRRSVMGGNTKPVKRFPITVRPI